MSDPCSCAACVARATGSTGVTGRVVMSERPRSRPHDDYDTPEMKKLSDTFERVKKARPDLSAYDALQAATAIVEGKQGLEDPDRIVLHEMAQRHMRETGEQSYVRALVAVSREYSELTAATSQRPAHVLEGEELDRATRRLMAERPGLSYRDALLEAGRIRYASGAARNTPSKSAGKDAPTGADPVGEEPHPDLPTVDEVLAYQKKKGIASYKVAMVQLVRIRAGMDPAGGQD